MALYANNGSIRVALKSVGGAEYTGGTGVYSKSGGYRIDDVSTTPGLYGPDGAYRGSVSTADGSPAPGVGRHTPLGGLRLVTSGATSNHGSDGHYAKDGGRKVTVL